MAACEGKLVTLVEERQKLSQANATMSKELTDAHQLIQEGFTKLVEASKEATKRVRQLSLGPDPPVLEDSYRSLPTVAEFIVKVEADVRVFKSNIVTQLANDKNTASKQTTAQVMAAFREAIPGAIVPDILATSPPTRSLRAVNALATALANKTFPPR